MQYTTATQCRINDPWVSYRTDTAQGRKRRHVGNLQCNRLLVGSTGTTLSTFIYTVCDEHFQLTVLPATHRLNAKQHFVGARCQIVLRAVPGGEGAWKPGHLGAFLRSLD